LYRGRKFAGKLGIELLGHLFSARVNRNRPHMRLGF
jgi:hypothetical protein